jgi:periplasmic glucans biosynthesis protein
LNWSRFPSSKEVNDNIVAYWVPKNLPPLGQLIEIAYRIHFQSEDFLDAASGRVTATRVGAGVPISVPSKRIFACSTPAPQC